MRYPRASAVVVALSTFVAVVTVAALASQLAPLDRAGAVLPDGPITIDGQQLDTGTVDEVAPTNEGSAPDVTVPDGTASGDAGQDAAVDGATVVVPAPAETVEPEHEPEPEPEPTDSSEAPGKSGQAPGRGDTPPGQGNP